MMLHSYTQELRAHKRKALVAFLTAGYPDEETFITTLRTASKAGCDLIEVGVPFSDPIADGPVIQAASTTALAQGMTLSRALDLCAAIAPELKPPLLIMSYVNPLLSMGIESFARRAADSEVKGVILPDVSFEESPPLRTVLNDAGVCTIDLLAPTSSPPRVKMIAQGAEGFVYLVSVTGVTGGHQGLSVDLGDFIQRVRAVTATPLYVGFGISTPTQAAAVAQQADGVIIGSQLLRLLSGEAGSVTGVGTFLREVRSALDAVASAGTS